MQFHGFSLARKSSHQRDSQLWRGQWNTFCLNGNYFERGGFAVSFTLCGCGPHVEQGIFTFMESLKRNNEGLMTSMLMLVT